MIVAWTWAVASATTWQQPPDELLEVLRAPDPPSTWIAPGGEHVLLATPVRYPPLADQAAAMHPLAGLRVDARTNAHHGRQGYSSPRVLSSAAGEELSLDVPDGARVLTASWSADGERLALTLLEDDGVGLWVGGVDGRGRVVDVSVNPLLGSTMSWTPDQRGLLVKAVPERGDAPEEPAIPAGPIIREGDGDVATSTYESRNTLSSAHDEALFEHFVSSQLVTVDVDTGEVSALRDPGLYADVRLSPDGRYLLVETLTPPWSHRHGYWRFAHDVDVWDLKRGDTFRIASLPLADDVPIHGVRTGLRSARWQATEDATLVWIEALDGGDWSAEVPHRDRVMRWEVPFRRQPEEVFRAEHRVQGIWWEPDGGAVVQQYERARRWRHVWRVDVERGKAEPWFDLSVHDRYADPGSPVSHRLADGRRVLVQEGDDVFFSGSGSSPDGDRPFLDRRSLESGEVVRLFRSDPERYERFVGFHADGSLMLQSESPEDPPNLWAATLGEPVDAGEGEAAFAHIRRQVTFFEDPTPQLREIERRIVTYEREDGVPLAFVLYLPPGYEEGTPLPTVLYAYPREFSDPETAGQVRGSDKTFTRITGSSHRFFVLQGYAVLSNTRLPVIGDPDTAYDTFVEQLVDGAEAAIAKAVELGVTDPERVGVMGHSHGGLMTTTLLAHSDLFRAGIARSGAYNHTIRPFGFQSERRTLWEATDTYLHLSPVMHAPEIDEPLLLIHGELDENPGTISFQSERLFEAVRGVGGTVRLVMLPHEGHGYRAKESVEHVLWEQLEWFDEHVKGAP